MRLRRTGRVFAFLALAGLVLAACQPAALQTTNTPAGPAETPAQTSEAGTEAPALEPTGAAALATPTGEGPGQPPTGIPAPEGWKTLTNTAHGYSLAYPAEWRGCQETEYSRLFCEDDPDWMEGTALRLYVSVVPQGSTNQDFEIYNFYPAEWIRDFMALPVGESQPKTPGVPALADYTYTRLPDRMVAGWTALVVESSKVPETPAGTKDRVVFIVTEGATYIIGMYYNTPEQLAMFEQILDTFQFVP